MSYYRIIIEFINYSSLITIEWETIALLLLLTSITVNLVIILDSYLSKINVGELKDLWETVKLYKIKKIYDNHASERDGSKQTHIPFKTFI